MLPKIPVNVKFAMRWRIKYDRSMKPTSEFMSQFQRAYLSSVAKILREGTMTLEQLQGVSREFLAVLPFYSYGDLEKKVRDFSQKFPQFIHLDLKLVEMLDEEKKKILMNRLQDQIHS